MPKILLLDIETAPNLVYSWGLWKQNIAIGQIVQPGYMLCWAAKWLGDRASSTVFRKLGDEDFLTKIHEMMDEADAVVHYNGKKFDIPTLHREFIEAGLTPPSPSKQVDLLTTCRSQFKFASNKLDYVCQRLGLGSKVKHKGMELWTACMAGDAQSWNKMRLYNIQDVSLLEKLYKRLLPWIKKPLNVSVVDDSFCCPTCGSENLVKRGFAVTAAAAYQRLRCSDCGTWSKSAKSIKTDNETTRFL